LKEWTTPDSRNAALNYKPRGRRDCGRARKRWQCVGAGTGQSPNPWRKMMMMSKRSIKLLEIQPRISMVKIRKLWKGIENCMEAVVME